MYDLKKTYVMTGVIVRVDPNPNHLQLFVAPLNEARDQVLKDSQQGAGGLGDRVGGGKRRRSRRHHRQQLSARHDREPRTVSAAHRSAGRRAQQVPLFKCPADTPPAPGKHCDSVKGATSYGQGGLPAPTAPLPKPASK